MQGDQQPVTDMREEFAVRRDYMYDRLSKMANISVAKPLGAFYMLVNIGRLGLTSTNFSDRLLSKAGVAVVPGVAFGDDRTIRLSYATPGHHQARSGPVRGLLPQRLRRSAA